MAKETQNAILFFIGFVIFCWFIWFITQSNKPYIPQSAEELRIQDGQETGIRYDMDR